MREAERNELDKDIYFIVNETRIHLVNELLYILLSIDKN